MALNEKLDVIRQVHKDTDSLTFGERNRIIIGLVSKLGFKAWLTWDAWAVYHPRRKGPLLILPQ